MQASVIRQLDDHKKDFQQLTALRCTENGIHLIPLKQSDFPLFAALYQNPTTMRFIAPPLKQQTVESLFSYALQQQSVEAPRCAYWKISTEGRDSCGLLGLMFDESNSAEIGIILKPFVRQPRISDVAMRRIAHFAFSNFNLTSINARIAVKNRPAQSLVIRLGFQKVSNGCKAVDDFEFWTVNPTALKNE